MMKRTLIALAIAAALGAGIFIGASIRPAQADVTDPQHRIAVATEQIARQLETMSRNIEGVGRHVEGVQRCTCK
jgi:hypothetical protein